jgi:rhodanese-related sulfurtransferase
MQLVKRVVVQALIVAAAGLAFALLANALSPRGLALTRDYFPIITAPTNESPSIPTIRANTNAEVAVPDNEAVREAFQRLQQRGLQPMTTQQTVESLKNPGYRQGEIVFVDARSDDNYQSGHIPGAWQLDYYHPEHYLTNVLAVCQKAQKVVVYCTGGECEDSELTAVMLRDAGIPASRLGVYAGGITDWKEKKLPVETGPRNSGQVSGSMP